MKTNYHIRKIDKKIADTSFLNQYQQFAFYDVYKIDNITLKFNGYDEPNYGRDVIKFQIFENSDDITKKFDRSGYVRTIKTEYVDFHNRFIFLPLENKLLFYKIDTKELIEIKEPFESRIKRIYKINNFMIILYQNGYIKVNTENFEYSYSSIENLDFITYVGSNEIVFIKGNKILIENGVVQEFPMEISNYYDNSKYQYWVKSAIDSQKGFLWLNGKKKIEGETYLEYGSLPIGYWLLTGYSDIDKKLTFGTSILTDQGEFDEVERIMRFQYKNEFIEINFFC